MITRLAPTPSGFLHTGNLYNFLLNWLWARSNDGKVLLRIDDADASRKRQEYIADIFTTLEWLGLDWDIGPTGPDDFEKNLSQVHRTDLYYQLLQELAAKGLLFGCTCSRSQLGNSDFYPGYCSGLGLPLHQPETAWRIKVPADTIISITDKNEGNINHIDMNTVGSFVVRRKDGAAAYQLSSLADDRHFGVTHICRGADLLASTAMQLYLDQQLTTPYLQDCHFWHHPLLATATGEKLSKSAGHSAEPIHKQVNKEAVLAGFARWMGWPEGLGLGEMVGLMENE